MQSGKVLPIIRQFFSGPTAAPAKSATDSHSQQHQQQQSPDREPTDEELTAARELLANQEEFLRKGLKVEIRLVDGTKCIVILGADGQQIRAIPRREVLRLLDTRALGKNSHYLGRILDRRI